MQFALVLLLFRNGTKIRELTMVKTLCNLIVSRPFNTELGFDFDFFIKGPPIFDPGKEKCGKFYVQMWS